MPVLYLDMNVYNRPFDNQTQWRNRMETLASQTIFQLAQTLQLEIVWSFMLEYENSLNPFVDRQEEIKLLSKLASRVIEPEDCITHLAQQLTQQVGMKNKDAIHLACADCFGCDFFITCDDKLTHKAKRFHLKVRVCGPIDFLQTVMNYES